jgi:hypothetical protein
MPEASQSQAFTFLVRDQRLGANVACLDYWVLARLVSNDANSNKRETLKFSIIQ